MAFDPNSTYTTVTDIEGSIYALQGGVVFDIYGNQWATIPKSKRNGWAAPSQQLSAAQLSGLLAAQFAYIGPYAGALGNYVPGDRLRFTDIGQNGVDLIMDAGYNFRPMHGSAVLYCKSGTIAAPIATLTGNGAVQTFVLPTNLLIMAGMLGQHSRLDVDAVLLKTGAHTGNFGAYLATSANPANWNSFDFMAVSANAATPSLVRLATSLYIGAASFIDAGNQTTWTSANAATQVWADVAVANISGLDRYIGFGIGASYTDSLASLIGYSVTLKG